MFGMFEAKNAPAGAKFDGLLAQRPQQRDSLDAQKLPKYADALRLDRVEMVHQWHKGKLAPHLARGRVARPQLADSAGQARDFLREDASTSLGLWRR
jgi:hypothetical protein